MKNEGMFAKFTNTVSEYFSDLPIMKSEAYPTEDELRSRAFPNGIQTVTTIDHTGNTTISSAPILSGNFN